MSLSCSDVGGSKVPTWRKESAGKPEEISSEVSTETRTLTIEHVQLGDSGLYYCDGEPAAFLSVTSGEQRDEKQQTNKLQYI